MGYDRGQFLWRTRHRNLGNELSRLRRQLRPSTSEANVARRTCRLRCTEVESREPADLRFWRKYWERSSNERRGQPRSPRSYSSQSATIASNNLAQLRLVESLAPGRPGRAATSTRTR